MRSEGAAALVQFFGRFGEDSLAPLAELAGPVGLEELSLESPNGVAAIDLDELVSHECLVPHWSKREPVPVSPRRELGPERDTSQVGEGNVAAGPTDVDGFIRIAVGHGPLGEDQAVVVLENERAAIG